MGSLHFFEGVVCFSNDDLMVLRTPTFQANTFVCAGTVAELQDDIKEPRSRLLGEERGLLNGRNPTSDPEL